MRYKSFLSLVILMMVFGCSKPKKEKVFDINASNKNVIEKTKASERIDFKSKGVGPVTELDLADTVSSELAHEGSLIFEEKCTLCHQIEAKFVGPALKDVLKRRSPEWVMNMILNPDRMLKEDSLARDLFIEFNGAPMSNQNLSREEARAVLEFLRSK